MIETQRKTEKDRERQRETERERQRETEKDRERQRETGRAVLTTQSPPYECSHRASCSSPERTEHAQYTPHPQGATGTRPANQLRGEPLTHQVAAPAVEMAVGFPATGEGEQEVLCMRLLKEKHKTQNT